MGQPLVAVVGRPNVGKSTLFNRLVGFDKAVVHDRPGVTRDRLYEPAELQGRHVLFVDTGGIESESAGDLLASMRRQSLIAVDEADVILFVVDGRQGLTPTDREIALLLRRSGKPVVLVVNKIDGPGQEELAADFWQLGMTPLVTVSSAHGRGLYELSDAVVERLPAHEPGEEDEDDDTEEILDEDEPAGPTRIAVVGRPNIGKSTLINKLLGEERHVVDDAPGTTMDPVDSALEVEGKQYVFVDTAGVRKRARIDDALERWVTLRAIRSIERCHVTLLMIDATEGVTDQDAKLAQLVGERGRAVIVLLNKWDLTKGNDEIDAARVRDMLEQKLPHLAFAPYLFLSAKTGRGVHRILPTVDRVFEEFSRRIPTPVLNRFLESAVHAHTPPQRYHHPVRLYYVAQTRVRPPTFAVFSNTPEGVGPAYRRYLVGRLREEFGFEGTPIRLHVRRRRKLGESAESAE